MASANTLKKDTEVFFLIILVFIIGLGLDIYMGAGNWFGWFLSVQALVLTGMFLKLRKPMSWIHWLLTIAFLFGMDWLILTIFN